MTDGPRTRAERDVRRIQAAAVERSLLDDDATEPYLVLAGALEGARAAARESDLEDATGLTPAMTAVLALFGVSRLDDGDPSPGDLRPAGPPAPPMPPEDDRRERLRVRGARVARDMGACSQERAAALAAVTEAEFETAEGRTAGTEADH